MKQVTADPQLQRAERTTLVENLRKLDRDFDRELEDFEDDDDVEIQDVTAAVRAYRKQHAQYNEQLRQTYDNAVTVTDAPDKPEKTKKKPAKPKKKSVRSGPVGDNGPKGKEGVRGAKVDPAVRDTGTGELRTEALAKDNAEKTSKTGTPAGQQEPLLPADQGKPVVRDDSDNKKNPVEGGAPPPAPPVPPQPVR